MGHSQHAAETAAHRSWWTGQRNQLHKWLQHVRYGRMWWTSQNLRSTEPLNLHDNLLIHESNFTGAMEQSKHKSTCFDPVQLLWRSYSRPALRYDPPDHTTAQELGQQCCLASNPEYSFHGEWRRNHKDNLFERYEHGRERSVVLSLPRGKVQLLVRRPYQPNRVV